MRTSIDIPAELIEEAKRIGQARTNIQIIILALTEFIQRRKSAKILELKGVLNKDYDYKELRRKR